MQDLTRLYAGKVIPMELQTVLRRLADLFGDRLRVTAIDAEGLTFDVSGLTGECLIRRLEMEQQRIFGANLSKFQILHALGNSADQGVYVWYLRTHGMRSEHLSGFWYY